MALTKEDLQAIGALFEAERENTRRLILDANAPIVTRLDAMQEDIDQIKEDTAITRETTNMIGEWTEIASDVLRISYPVKKQ